MVVPRNLFTYYVPEINLNDAAFRDAKQNKVSAVVSTLASYEAHVNRVECVRFLALTLTPDEFVLFGRGGKMGLGDVHKGELVEKADGLIPYRYHFAAENTRVPGPNPSYWTEKVADPIMCGCVVLYDGAGDIDKYFPPGVIIPIDTREPEIVACTIRSVLSSNHWRENYTNLMIAQAMIRERWGPYPTIAEGVARYGRMWEER